MRVIDAHQHLWNPVQRAYPWMADDSSLRRTFDSDDLAAATQSTDVAATVVVQAAPSLDETLSLLNARPPVAGVVGWVDLEADDVLDQLSALIEHPGRVPLVGIRHQAEDEPDPDWLARPAVKRGVRALASRGLAFDLLVRERNYEAALRLVDDVPDARFVLDHAGKPPIRHDRSVGTHHRWRMHLDAFALRPNTWCKLSGLQTEAAPDQQQEVVDRYARTVVETFGSERTLWGSDWPVSTRAGSYPEMLQTMQVALVDRSSAEREQIFSATAERVYGLRQGNTATGRGDHTDAGGRPAASTDRRTQ